MPPLLSLEKAKKHLRVTTDDHDDDIQDKIEEASGIILDYLKGRANNPATIETSSVANPTVITTETAHGFSNGNTVTISGHEDSAPDLNASWTISNVTSDTFTIPANVTVAGTGGTATVLWTEDTVPSPVKSATALMLTHLYEHRGDDQATDANLWQAIERVLMRARDPALA